MAKIIILSMLLLTSCVPFATPSPSVEFIPPTQLPLSFTETPVSPTPPLPLLTPTSASSLADDCFRISEKDTENEWGSGVVALDNQKVNSSGFVEPGFFLLNMVTRKATDLEKPNEGFANVFASPDGTMLSGEYLKFEKNGENVKTLKDDLVIMTADGIVQKAFPWEDGWVSGAVWLDNQHVVINIAGLNADESQAIKPSTLLVLNPFTGERKMLKPNLPGIYDGYPLPFWGDPWRYSLSVYNQPLSRAVYLSEGGYTYVLWDVQKRREILRLVDWFSGNDERPSWSPDGSKFVMSAYSGNMDLWPQPADGLYLIDSDGNVTKLLSTDKHTYFYDHFWSPSGRYIALLVDKSNSSETRKRLWVFDTQSSQVVDTCVEYRSWLGDDTPVWSPDETQILLYDSTEENSKVILVDLAKRIAFPIAEDMEPRGWLKTP